MSVINQAVLNRYRRPKDIDRGLVLDLPLRCGITARKGTIAPTFARNSTATYINPGDATLKTAAVNEPRFEANGLLMEPQSTNYFLNSDSPANHTSASLGTGTYTLWLDGTGSVAVAAGTATGSGWGTASAGTKVTVTITGAGTVVFTVTGSPTRALFESCPVRSSYIPTAGSAVTRYADTLSYAMSDKLKSIFSVDQGWSTTLADETGFGLPGNDASNYTDGSAKFDVTGQDLSAFGDAQYCIIARDASNRLAWGWCKAASGTGFTVVNSPGGTTQNWVKEASFSGSATTFDIIPASQVRSEGTVMVEWAGNFPGTALTSSIYLIVFDTSLFLYLSSGSDSLSISDGSAGSVVTSPTSANTRYKMVARFKNNIMQGAYITTVCNKESVRAYDGSMKADNLCINTTPFGMSWFKNIRIFNRWLSDGEIQRLAGA